MARNNLTVSSLTGFSNGIKIGEGNLSDAELRKCSVTVLRMLKLKGKTFDGSCFENWRPAVTVLDLEGTGITDETAKFLSNVARVYRLNLSNTKITNAALPFLSNVPYLNLSNTGITFEGLLDARFSTAMGIQVAVGQFSVEQVRALKKKLPIVVGKM